VSALGYPDVRPVLAKLADLERELVLIAGQAVNFWDRGDDLRNAIRRTDTLNTRRRWLGRGCSAVARVPPTTHAATDLRLIKEDAGGAHPREPATRRQPDCLVSSKAKEARAIRPGLLLSAAS
jgi:hypothetical protein